MGPNILVVLWKNYRLSIFTLEILHPGHSYIQHQTSGNRMVSQEGVLTLYHGIPNEEAACLIGFLWAYELADANYDKKMHKLAPLIDTNTLYSCSNTSHCNNKKNNIWTCQQGQKNHQWQSLMCTRTNTKQWHGFVHVRFCHRVKDHV